MTDEQFFNSDEEYEKRRQLRRQKVEAEKRRQQRNRKLFMMGAAALLVIIVAVVLIVVIVNVSKKSKTDDKVSVAGSEIVISESADVSQNLENVTVDTDASSSQTDNSSDTNGNKVKQFELDGMKYVYSADSISQMSSDEYTSEYGILINTSTGKVIGSKQGYSKMYPASMTKVMTVLTARQYISDADLDKTIEITQEASDFSYSNDCSSAGFSTGERVTLRDLFYGTILPSGGESAYSLAVYVAGSHEAFVELMNENVAALGLSETTHFTNCVGIYNNNHYSTCYDIAIIMIAAMEDDFLSEVLNARRYTTSFTSEHPEGIELSNWFNRRIEDHDTGGYINGSKTGFVNESGSCAVSSMKASNGDNFICVSGKTTSSWRCIFDHIAAYNIYAVGNVGYTRN